MAVYKRDPSTGVETTVAGIQDLSVYETRISNIEEVVPSDATSSNQLVTESDLGTAAGKDYTDNVRPNNHNLVESNAVYSAINNAISTIYTPRGSIACADLTSDLLIEANIGNVYETSDSGTTTALFMQGAGETINQGDSVSVIKAGENTILFNLMGGTIDLSDYQKKDLASAVEGQTTVEGAFGALSTNKASKVSNAIAGDIASLDANGNLVDSGASIKNGGTKVLALKGNDNLHPADLNDLTEAGVYSIISQGSSNLPNSEYFTWWQIIVITKSDTSANQGYCTQYAMARNNLVYMRDCEAGTWSSWQKLVAESDLNAVMRFYEYTSSNVPTKTSFLTLLASSNAHIDFKFINVTTDYMPNSSSYWYVQKFGGMDALHIRLLATDWVSGDLYTGDANSSNNTITWWRLAGTQV